MIDPAFERKYHASFPNLRFFLRYPLTFICVKLDPLISPAMAYCCSAYKRTAYAITGTKKKTREGGDRSVASPPPFFYLSPTCVAAAAVSTQV